MDKFSDVLNHHFLVRLIPFFLIISGIGFRLIFPGSYGIGFDQVQILENAKNILNGDVTLIGPRTGPAAMFTGPLIYYLSAPFKMFFGDFATIFLVPTAISLTTGLVIFFIIRSYIGTKESLIALSIWALSPFLVELDRVFWNPNLTLLSSVLLFVPLIAQKDKKSYFIALFMGAFLSYQAHFSGIFMVMLSIATIITFRRKLSLLIPILTGFFLSIIPTIIFDTRNGFLNFNGLLDFFSHSRKFDLILVMQDFLHNTYIIIETFGKLFLYGSNTPILIALGLYLFGISIFKSKWEISEKISLFWIISTSIAYAFYNKEKPEYYFLIVVMPLIFIFINLFRKIKKDYQLILFTFFLLSSIFLNLKFVNTKNGINIRNTKNIHAYLEKKEVKEIVYDTEFGSDLGLRYFLTDIKLSDSGSSYHISFPNQAYFDFLVKVGDIGIWRDHRNEEEKNYVTTDRYILESNKDIFMYLNTYPKNKIQDYDSYIIILNQEVVGELNIAEITQDKISWVQECKNIKAKEWTLREENEYLKVSNSFCMKIKLDNQAGWVDSLYIY